MSHRVIKVIDYDQNWVALFESEKTRLAMAIGDNGIKIEHIGSTSVAGLAAKPIIDILIEVKKLSGLDSINKEFEALGYIVKGENGISGRRFYEKGGDRRSHHIHAFKHNDFNLLRHRAFKEYLLMHHDVALEYAQIKKEALVHSGNNINVYVARKSKFIKKHEKLALQWADKLNFFSNFNDI